MSDNKGNYSNDEIDDFAKALLDKKTEIQLYGEEDDELMIGHLNQIQTASKPASAQAQTKEEPASKQDKKEVLSVLNKMNADIPVIKVPAKEKKQPKKKTAKKAEKNDKSEKSEKNANPSGSGSQPKKTEKKKGTAASKRSSVKKKLWIAIIVLTLIVVGLLAGYAYKVVVWDPANHVTEAQQTSYNKLIEYADEYDMMSDTEKLELLDLESDYNGLLEKQKKSINQYFKEQTGKTFDDLLHELKTLNSGNSEDNADYTALTNFFDNWDSMSDTQRAALVNYRNQYDSLSQTLKNKLDSLILKNTGSNFNSLYSQYTMQKPDHSEEIGQLQKQISDLESEITSLKEYNKSLQEDIDNAAEGDDTSEYKNYIDQNNQTISQYEGQITDLKNQISELQN